jgi:hypothetical protein
MAKNRKIKEDRTLALIDRKGLMIKPILLPNKGINK